ncbi:hypothetical protein EV140_1940 [Microcella alkaliphila]|uniref:Uncharacterized protein n=1 Tax=Microcella alkaliphila TaxID=279828 RepID=A0A4Q7TFS5_9MICO|nr:hypothetical protein [Microcella alkaliphila]RZT59335.1 hypothetical protein EV140_1940 [Microcella alkaliphila]
MADGNVTRIHPAPSIPNPLMHNPWAALTDEQIEEQIFAAKVRIDAAEHTVRSLEREAMRRNPAKRLVRDAGGRSADQVGAFHRPADSETGDDR